MGGFQLEPLPSSGGDDSLRHPPPGVGCPKQSSPSPPPQPRPQRRPRRSARATGGRSAAGGGVGIAIYLPTLQPLLSHKQPVFFLRVSIFQSLCFSLRFCRQISRNLTEGAKSPFFLFLSDLSSFLFSNLLIPSPRVSAPKQPRHFADHSPRPSGHSRSREASTGGAGAFVAH